MNFDQWFALSILAFLALLGLSTVVGSLREQRRDAENVVVDLRERIHTNCRANYDLLQRFYALEEKLKLRYVPERKSEPPSPVAAHYEKL